MIIELIKKRAQRLFARLAPGQRKKLAQTIDAGDPMVVRALMARLATEEQKRAEEERVEKSRADRQKRLRESGPIHCLDCRVKEGDYHLIGCRHGLCGNARGYTCAAPTRLLRRDQIPVGWVIPPPDWRRSKWFVRLPSQCGECGSINSFRSGPQ
jgi:hypothetical protein